MANEGLTTAIVNDRSKQFGPNEIKRGKKAFQLAAPATFNFKVNVSFFSVAIDKVLSYTAFLNEIDPSGNIPSP